MLETFKIAVLTSAFRGGSHHFKRGPNPGQKRGVPTTCPH